MIFQAFFRALTQIDDPRFRRVLFLGIGLTLMLLIAVTAGFFVLIGWLTGDSTTLPLIGEVPGLQGAFMGFGRHHLGFSDDPRGLCHYLDVSRRGGTGGRR